MSLLQYARGLWAQFGPGQNPFGVPNGMEENLRVIDDHLGLYTLTEPVAPGTAFPETPNNGDGQIYTDGTYATFNAGTWKLYPSRVGIKAAQIYGALNWVNAGSSWEQFTSIDESTAEGIAHVLAVKAGAIASIDDKVAQVEVAKGTAIGTTIPGKMAEVEAAKVTAITVTIPAKVAEVEAAKNTAINTAIPAAVALVDTAVAVTAAGSATAAKVAAEAARDVINTTGKVFTSAEGTAAGIAATTSGQQFAVLSSDSWSWLIYRNNSGAALLIGPGSYTKAYIDLLYEKMLRALLARNGVAANLSNYHSISTNSLAGVQALFRWTGAAKSLVKGYFVSLRLKGVTGGLVPSSASDAAVFGGALRVQAFQGGTLAINQNLLNLSGTDIWYYTQNTGSTDITEIKVFASPATGINFTFDECTILADGGLPFPEITSRNLAIANAVTADYEALTAAMYREGAETNLFTTTSLTGSGTIQLQQAIARTLSQFSCAFILECDGAYPTLAGEVGLRVQAFRAGTTLSGDSVPVRIGSSKVWYVKDVAAGTGPHTSIKITANPPAGGTTVTIRQAVFVEDGGYALPLSLLISAATAGVTATAVAAATAAANAAVATGLLNAVGWPTTALEAIGAAATRRVDFLMLGDSNQLMDGNGFDYAFRQALHARFGTYASSFRSETFGVAQAHSTGGSVLQESKQVALYGYQLVPDGVSTGTSVFNGITVGPASFHPMNPSSLLRCHYAYGTFATGAGSFKVGVRREESPYNVLQMQPTVNTNTGADTYVRTSYDLAAGGRDGQLLAFKWVVPTQTQATGPFISHWMRVEDVNKIGGVSCHTVYAAGGQSLWDMGVALNATSIAYLRNLFAEVRQLQLDKGQKPIVVFYINSGLNDQNETSTPSLGYRASTTPDSATAYLDNLEALMKRFSDVWQSAGWPEKELFFLIVPSHPISSPDAAKLVAYRKAAQSLAVKGSRVSMVDFENLTSYTEMAANSWYRTGISDLNHLSPAGYAALATKSVALVP